MSRSTAGPPPPLPSRLSQPLASIPPPAGPLQELDGGRQQFVDRPPPTPGGGMGNPFGGDWFSQGRGKRKYPSVASKPQSWSLIANPQAQAKNGVIMTIASIVDEALALPLAERSYVAERLLLSLDDDRPLSDEWREEIARRVARRAAGESRSFSRDEVRRDVQALLA